MQKRLYFLNINLFIIHIVTKNFIINLKLLLTVFYKFTNMTTSKAIKLIEQDINKVERNDYYS